MIEVTNLNKSFGSVKALDDLSIRIKKASVYGLLGPNGAGKTTLIKHLVGIYKQDEGVITVGGESVYENPIVKSSIVYIPDNPYFFSQYSIEETAKLYATIYPTWNQERFQALGEVFPIDKRIRVTKLSKGMQKQVAFWLGICVMPEVMILDEPVDGLDPVMRKKVWNLMLQDVAERQTTILVASHNLRELEDVCDHVGILHHGKIVVERELDNMKSDIHKLQIAFLEEIPEGLFEELEVLHCTQNGSVVLLIARGDKGRLVSMIEKAKPAVLDILPLTLEEIFIYELGGMGYDLKSILI
ncbi:ABC-2 type transport system ATP-binding protein [Natronincola peptidivorans]|uniref:ABC-2 type transport system ATP-binding protein n=1 Tax=Natronincola peptidivorans TaxID=426128 RepID=A0A1I0CE66_9FIRM|nr:ABC transporter ATP-binding protein [Natronincola peptidivorans]SET17738.1 ABC-2 type transport system ATP-binding protein [Natronincola peptidivorans]